jgi:hypothetical protein
MFSAYSAASEDSTLGSSELGCVQSPSASPTPTAAPFSPDGGQASLLLQMSESSPASPATCSQPVSHAKTSVMLVLALELGENDPLSGLKSRASLANFDPDSFSWKTYQRSLTEEWESFSEVWPESGMTRNGRLYQHAPWALHMCDDECSLWPTPTASMDGRGFGIPLHENSGRYKLSTVRRVHELVGEHGWRIHPHFTEALMGFPTDASAIEPSETPSSPRSQKQSAEQS